MIKKFFWSLLNIIISIYNGIDVTRILIFIAFVYLPDKELIADIKDSALARISLSVGVIIAGLVCLYTYRHGLNYYVLTYLIWQLIRFLYFMGQGVNDQQD